jgi:hypothetical protein
MFLKFQNSVTLLLISLVLPGCGFFPSLFSNDMIEIAGPKYSTSNPVFLSYISEFEKEVGVSASQIPIVFENVKAGGEQVVGTCNYYPGGAEVYIDQKYWELASDECKKQLIWHELGHCALNRDHKDTIYRSFPVSVMVSIISSCFLTEENYQAYADELRFSRDVGVMESIDDFFGF